jgi:hypothetical protein
MSHPTQQLPQIPAAALGLAHAPVHDAELETTVVSGEPSPLRESALLDGAEGGEGKGARIVLSGAWEQELLISGAVVFALVQLPGLVDGAFHWLDGQVSGPGWTMSMMGYEFSKLILYALISCFVVHLVARGYWVGLMGLHSVFPGGVQWDRSRAGPVAQEIYRRRFPTLPQSIAAADDFCSTLFSAASMLVINFAAAILWCAAALAVVWAISTFGYGGQWQPGIFTTLFVAFAFIPAGLYQVDRRFGARMPAGSVGRRILEAGFLFFFYASFLRLAGPISQVLFTNLPRRRAYVLMFSVMAALMTLFIVKDLLIQQGGGLSLGRATFVPARDDPRADNAQHYEDQRSETAWPLVPSIPSDVVEGPYVRLFIPYVPRKHDPAVAARCPGVAHPGDPRTPGAEARVRAVADCLARIQRVWLNGRPLTGVAFRFRTDPESGARGLVGYVPTAGLPRGENVLTVERAPLPPESVAMGVKPAAPYEIRFWI